MPSITTLPCEIQNINNAKLQQDIIEENGIKISQLHQNVFQGHAPYIYLFYN